MSGAISVHTSGNSDGLRRAFVGWQCRARQAAMRERQGRPDDAVAPLVRTDQDDGPAMRIITVLNRKREYSVTPEFRHLAKRSMDPAAVRDSAVKFLASGYFQGPDVFSDVLTAIWPGDSLVAARLARHGRCVLEFSAYAHRFDLDCRILKLDRSDHLFQATWWHNRFFNPDLREDVRILGFCPDWTRSTANAAADDGPRPAPASQRFVPGEL